MSDIVAVFQAELAELIVHEMRRYAGGQGFKAVSLYEMQEGEIPGTNWEVANVNYGDADERVCDAALREIIPRMQKQYRIKS